VLFLSDITKFDIEISRTREGGDGGDTPGMRQRGGFGVV
jgi:hypothetical protein